MSLPRDGKKIKRESVTPVLEKYAEKLHRFQFDQAKDIVDEYRNGCGVSGDARHMAWLSLLQSLAALTQVERSYLALSFMAPKGFLRTKTQLKTNYNAIRTELQKASESLKSALEISAGTEGPSNCPVRSESLAEHLLQQFHSYICARIDMMNFYEKCALIPTGKGLNIAQATELLEELQERHTGAFHHPLISKMDSSFSYEVEILLNLLRCQQALSKLAFLPSLLHLSETHSRIKTWIGGSKMIEDSAMQSVSSWFSFGSTPKRVPVSLDLCIWLQKFYDRLISKFSLYFYDILSRQAPPAEIKAQLAKVPFNYAQKLSAFHRRHDAHLVCIIMDANDDPNFQTVGYHHPDKELEPLKGMERYPVIFSHPPEKPSILLPSIVMLISNENRSAEPPNNIIYSYDGGKSLSLFVSRLEENIYLVIVLPGKKNEKEGSVVSVIQEIATNLNCDALFSQLKHGVKD